METTLFAGLTLFACAAIPDAPAAQEAPPRALVWDAEACEHLLNRAAFGATRAEVEEALALGQVELVERLLGATAEAGEAFWAEPLSTRDGAVPEIVRGLSRRERRELEDDEAVREAYRRMQAADREQMFAYGNWWIERMVEGRDPLRERMVLFWHGHFTSGFRDVKSSYEMIRQNELFRELALGDFRDLLHAIARDPAMLEYLDNDRNRRGSPNENFSRELVELFTLGEGNYTEHDVREIARAFTGWTDDRGEFTFRRAHHDHGSKTVLGVTGELDGDDVLEILLDQPACAEHVAGSIVAYFEGVEPSAERRESYAAVLRESDYEIEPLLRALFLDPDFYRDEVRGARVSGPVDYLVGACRRLGTRGPAPVINVGSRALGQALFEPPNVQGWEGGHAWISTSTLMNRGNLAGVLLGQVDLRDILRDDVESGGASMEDPAMGAPGMEVPAMGDDSLDRLEEESAEPRAEPGESPGRRTRLGEDLEDLRDLRRFVRSASIQLSARVRSSGARDDDEVAAFLLDELLAIPAPEDTLLRVTAHVTEAREAEGLDEGEWLRSPRVSEPLLRGVAHLVLSLPEAQLH